jgi:FtsZ-binding cell division protein ZapB
MDSLDHLEERVMLAVQTIRILQDERAKLKAEMAQTHRDLETARGREADAARQVEELKNLAKENELLKTKHDEIRARVEQLVAKLEKFEREVAEGDAAQGDLLAP